MNDFEVLARLTEINWVDRERAYGLFMSYSNNRKDLTGEEIIRVIESIVPQMIECKEEV